jgi:hypothetical protein
LALLGGYEERMGRKWLGRLLRALREDVGGGLEMYEFM